MKSKSWFAGSQWRSLFVLSVAIIVGGLFVYGSPHASHRDPQTSLKLAKVKNYLKHLKGGPDSGQAGTYALLEPSSEQTEDLPVVHKSGVLESCETWIAGNVYMIDSTVYVPNDCTLTIEAGAIVKSATAMIYVNGGSSLDVQGSSSNPVIFTSYKDDAVGGDSNSDGASSGAQDDYSLAVNAQGGDITISHAIMEYGDEAIERMTAGGTVSVSDSLIKSRIRANYYQVSLARNEFDIDQTSNPVLDLYGNADVSDIALSGADSNTFTGANKTIYLGNASVSSGDTWDVDGASGVVLYAASTNIYGTLNLSGGVVVKTPSGAFNVYSGGAINATGTNSNHIIFTSYQDDSVGGDSNGDGASAGAPNDYGVALNCQGGDINITGTTFRYGTLAIDKQYGGAAIVTDSIFNSSVRTNYFPITLQNNEFNAQGYLYAIDAYGDSDLSAISLSGSTSNHFTGLRTIYAGNASIPAGWTWGIDGSSNAVLYGGVQVYGTLNLSNGAILKPVQYGSGLDVYEGGVINVSGSSANPVTFTSYKDDSVGGDTNQDGNSSGNHGDYDLAINIKGGDVNVSHAVFKYGSSSIAGQYGCTASTSDIHVEDSEIDSGMNLGWCGISSLSLERNHFDVIQGSALFLPSINPDSIILAGSNKNVFVGSDAARNIWLGNNTNIPSGSVWTIDGSSNAVILTSSITVDGTLNLQNGAIIKNVNGFAVTVNSGGILNADSSTSPIIFTSYKDDSVGGDNGMDGATTGTNQDGGTLITNNGGTVNISHAILRDASLAFNMQSAGPTTIEDSTVNVCISPKWYPITLERNHFDIPADGGTQCAIDAGQSTDPTGIVLSGSDKNTFAGSGFGRSLVIGGADIPVGKTWSIDGSTGIVVVPGSTNIYGTLNLSGNLTVKPTWGTGFSIKDDGTLNVDGGSGQVLMTSYKNDASGGDSNNDGVSTPASGDYGAAFDLQSGGTLNANKLKVEYAGNALTNYGGSATFEATDIDHVGNGLYVPNGDVTYRGSIKNVDTNSIAACDWFSTSCSVDATYTDWSSSSGPTNACGKVLTVPFKYGGTDHNGIVFINNCGSSTNPYQQVQNSGATFADIWQVAEETCNAQQTGYQDYCDQVDRMHTCINGAIDIADNTSPFALTTVDSYNEAAGYADVLNGDANSFIIGHVIETAAGAKAATVYGYATQFGQLFQSIYTAFDTCR